MASTAKPAYGGRVLHGGSSGPDVALVQRWLNGVRRRWPAIRPVTVDGKYGSSTATAVKTFQLLNSLRSDGAVGPATWDAMYAAHAAQQGEGEIWPGMTMRPGMHGAAVKSAQTRLKTLVPNLTADGDYGARTRAAVRAWQTTHGLPADGILGRNTWNSLFGVK